MFKSIIDSLMSLFSKTSQGGHRESRKHSDLDVNWIGDGYSFDGYIEMRKEDWEKEYLGTFVPPKIITNKKEDRQGPSSVREYPSR